MFQSPLPVAILNNPPASSEAVRDLSQALGLPVVSDPTVSRLLLRFAQGRLELCKPGDPKLPGALWVDFATTASQRRVLRPQQELLVRAAKVRMASEPLVIDATAGLGRDGFLLAAAGFRVRMLEYNPIVAALLADGLTRARRIPALAGTAARIHLEFTDALTSLSACSEQPEVIYLDPMFPERTKSALVKQHLRLLQLISLPNETEEKLLQKALAVGARKVVVKRPCKGPPLASMPPSYTLRGKAVRFDVYLGPGKQETGR